MAQQTQEPRLATLIRQDAERTLRDRNIQPGSTIMAEKKNPGRIGQNIEVITNVHNLKIHKRTTIYRYEVELLGILQPRPNGEQRNPVDLTGPAASDFIRVDRRYRAEGVFQTFKALRAPVLTGNFLYYDLKRILYALKEIPSDAMNFECNVMDIQNNFRDDFNGDFVQYAMKITPVTEHFQMTLGEFDYITRDAAQIDRALEQFLDIATAQEVFDRPHEYTNYSAALYYLLNPSAYGFSEADCPYFESNHSFLGIGANKSVRSIEGQNNISNGLVVEVKKTPFHINGNDRVTRKFFTILGNDYNRICNDLQTIKTRVEPLLKGIYVRTTYRSAKFPIFGLSTTDAHHELIHQTSNSLSKSLYKYFIDTHGITLEFPQLPLIVRREGQRVSYYPMELCLILDNQRVKELQQTPLQIQSMIRKCAISPFLLRQQNAQLADSLQLVNSNCMIQAGLQFDNNPIQTNARVIPPPDLAFGAQHTEKVSKPQCKWRGQAPYLISATCHKWAAIVLSGTGTAHSKVTDEEWNNFLVKYTNTMRQKGMQWPEPTKQVIPYASGFDMKQLMNQYSNDNFEFVLIAHPDNADRIHLEMKYYEQKTELVTQGLKITTVKEIAAQKPKVETLGNIVNKTNIKMGGLNYAVLPQNPAMKTLFGNDTLVIGFAMNHPGGGIGIRELEAVFTARNGNNNSQSLNVRTAAGLNGNTNGNNIVAANGNQSIIARPSASQSATSVNRDRQKITPAVVGFSSNTGKKNAFEFIGDYYFQDPFQDANISLIADVVKHCAKNFYEARNVHPRRIIFFQNGTSEGNFSNILKYEVPLVKGELAELCNSIPKITLIVINKIQSIRMYAKTIDRGAKNKDQNIPPGTVLDTNIVHPKWTEFFLNSHVAIQGTARTPRYNVLIDENNLSMDNLQAMTHYLCFGHQIVFSPTSLPTPVYVALEYAKRGRNNYNAWIAAENNSDITNNNVLTKRLGYQLTAYLKHLRVNA